MRRIKELLRLKYAGALSHEQIARALKLSKGVVSKYISRAAQVGIGWPDAAALDETELEQRLFPRTANRLAIAAPDCAWIHQELKHKGVTLQLLWEEYTQRHSERTYSYTQFCVTYRHWRDRLKRSMRQTHHVGEKVFVDYAGQTVPIHSDRTRQLTGRAQIFVAVLGASNYTYACATETQNHADWIAAHVRCFEFFGGVPTIIVPDQPRALITTPDRYEPEAHRSYEDMANHYGSVIIPARPRKPQDKAKVEVGVQIVERWILARLRHRRFYSLRELNDAIAGLIVQLNERPFKKLPGCRASAFAELDQSALKPLPATAYEYAQFKRARVNIDYHIEVAGHYYSVPHALARSEVEVRLTATTVEVLSKGNRVASHIRSRYRGRHTTVAEHMPKSHRAHLEWTPGRLLNWAHAIGPATLILVRHQLESKPHPEMGYRACLGVLALARKYGRERLEAACAHAVRIGALRRKSVASILQAGLDQQSDVMTERQAELPLPLHENVRGPKYYH
jgi:transposase